MNNKNGVSGIQMLRFSFCLIMCLGNVSCQCVLSMCLGPCLFSPRPLSPIRNPRSRPCMYGTYTSVQLRIVLKPCFSPSHHADEQCRLLYLFPPAIPYPYLHLYLHLLNVTYEIRMFVTFNMCHVVSACHCVKGVFSLFEKSLFFVCIRGQAYTVRGWCL